MALVYADRVKETTTTTGTGTINLAGAATGFQTFVAGIGNGNTVKYCITDGTDWEVGEGTVTDGTPDTLSRTTIHSSSNAGSAVNWGAGAKDVFGTLPAADFPAAGGGGALTLLETQVISLQVSSIDFEENGASWSFSDYDIFLVRMFGVRATGNGGFCCRIGTGAGTPTYQTASNYRHAFDNTISNISSYNSNNTSAGSFWRIGGFPGSATTSGFNGDLFVYDPSNSAKFPSASLRAMEVDGSSNTRVNAGAAHYNSATAITALRFFHMYNNLVSGSFSLFGVAT